MIHFNQKIRVRPGMEVDNLAMRNSVNRIDPVHKIMVIFFETFLEGERKGFLPELCGGVTLEGEEFEKFYADWVSTEQLYHALLTKVHDLWSDRVEFNIEKCVIDDKGEIA